MDLVTLILSQVKIAPLGEVDNFAVGYRALEHPESAVGVDELYAAFAEGDLIAAYRRPRPLAVVLGPLAKTGAAERAANRTQASQTL